MFLSRNHNQICAGAIFFLPNKTRQRRKGSEPLLLTQLTSLTYHHSPEEEGIIDVYFSAVGNLNLSSMSTHVSVCDMHC